MLEIHHLHLESLAQKAKNTEEEQNNREKLLTKESLRKKGVALIVNKRGQNAVLRCNLKNDRMISFPFQMTE